MSEEKEMSFLDHLEELRWHLIRGVAAVGVFMVGAAFMNKYIFDKIILAPSRPDFITYKLLCQLSEATCIEKLPFTIQSRLMTGQFTMYITSLFIVAFICSFPYIVWEVWRFIAPGLYPTERKATRGAVFFVSLLFALGISFGYFILAPLSINFLANFQLSDTIVNEFDIVSYVSTVVMLVVGCGIIFQLPIAVYFLTRMGLLTPAIMRKYRRHAIVIILILSGIITPPDVLSQIIISLPVAFLYELGIFIATWVEKKNLQEAQESGLVSPQS